MIGYQDQYFAGQNAGYYGGQGFGQTAGYTGGQSYGQTGGFYGGQGYGQTAGFVGGAGYGQTAGFVGGAGYGQGAGYTGGQNVVFSAVPVAAPVTVQSTGFQPAADFSFAQQASSNHVEFRQQSGSSSSSSPLGADVSVNIVGSGSQVNASPYQGAATAGSFDASGASVVSATGGQRRQGRVRKQVVRLPDQPQGPARQVRHRMPTPEPDTIERVLYQRAAPELIEEIVEVPTTPPPRIQEKHVVEPAGPPQKIKRVIRVPPRSAGVAAVSQQTGGAQFSSNLISAGSYGNVQQGFGGVAPSVGFGGVAPVARFGGFQQGFGGFSSNPVGSLGNPSQGTCFYV